MATPQPAAGVRLGLQIVRSLTEELGGKLSLTSNGGTRAEIRLPADR
ncbi:MAG TPA: ATP-binding protein [Actinomycetota bacterium]|nr:ATP-binding protein [Actinomycetota bacterium]